MSPEPATQQPTDLARRRYDRLARFYDVMEWGAERRLISRWRQRQWGMVRGRRVLKVGVGTGKNMVHYPAEAHVTAIDLSPEMLRRARDRAARHDITVDLHLMDAQRLEFPDDEFDTAVATFVFCSVPDPVAGLRELRRVTRGDGRVLLLEHVRPPGVMGTLADMLNPLFVRITGANINRRTTENVVWAGLEIERVEDLWHGVVRLIVAVPGTTEILPSMANGSG